MSGPLTMTARVGYRWRITFAVEPDGIDTGAVTALMMRMSSKVRGATPTKRNATRRVKKETQP